MKPCDCKEGEDINKLKESGISYNGILIEVRPPNVGISIGTRVNISIPQLYFKRFAKWYLEEQDENS